MRPNVADGMESLSVPPLPQDQTTACSGEVTCPSFGRRSSRCLCRNRRPGASRPAFIGCAPPTGCAGGMAPGPALGGVRKERVPTAPSQFAPPKARAPVRARGLQASAPAPVWLTGSARPPHGVSGRSGTFPAGPARRRSGWVGLERGAADGPALAITRDCCASCPRERLCQDGATFRPGGPDNAAPRMAAAQWPRRLRPPIEPGTRRTRAT